MKARNFFGLLLGLAVFAAWILLVGLCITAMTGCSRRVLPAASHSLDSSHISTSDSAEFRGRVRYDSIYLHDSVTVVTRADTVFLTRIQWRDRFLAQHDTIVLRTSIAVHDTLIRRDSIPYPVEVIRSEKHVPTVYRWSLWLCIGFALFWLVKSGIGGKIWRWVIGLIV